VITPTPGAPAHGAPTPLPPGPAPREVHLWFTETGSWRPDLDLLTYSLSRDERERARGILSDRRRREFVLGRTMLRSLLGHYLGTDGPSVDLRLGAEGRPALVDGGTGLDFNLAHSHELLACAFGHKRVGVDVERLRPVPEARAIAERYFTPRERAWLEARGADDPSHGFLELWSCKEAVVKALGSGIAGAWSRVEVVPGPEGSVVAELEGEPTEWTLLTPRVVPGHAVAIAVPEPGASVQARPWIPEDWLPS
jgi:4'-phosphopantetheinyl transferase